MPTFLPESALPLLLKSNDLVKHAKRSLGNLFPNDLGSKAMVSRPGGIDLIPVKNVLQTQNNWQGGIKFRLDPVMFHQLKNAPGFVPVIINIQPMTDLESFLEINPIDKATVNS